MQFSFIIQSTIVNIIRLNHIAIGSFVQSEDWLSGQIIKSLGDPEYLMLGKELSLPDQLVNGRLEPEHRSREDYAVQLLWAMRQVEGKAKSNKDPRLAEVTFVSTE